MLLRGDHRKRGWSWQQDGSFAVAGAGEYKNSGVDNFHFAYTNVTGDFDYRVRMRSFTQSNPYAKAGLMARATLAPDSAFAATLATPTLNGAFFEYRSSMGSLALATENFPVNYPEMWLRLKRVNTQFTGYGSYDGITWQQLGSGSLSVTGAIYFGMAVCSHNSCVAGTAQFRNIFGWYNVTGGMSAWRNAGLPETT